MLAATTCCRLLSQRAYTQSEEYRTEDELRALVDARTRQSKDVYLKHFKDVPDDLSLIVLKGHLLVERAVVAVISHYAEPSVDLEQVRFGFMQKVMLAKALVPLVFVPPEFWGFAKLLNQLRNDLAHKLEPKELADHLMAVLRQRKVYGHEIVFPVVETDEARLKYLISAWLGVLDPVDSLIHTIEKSTVYTVDLVRLGEIVRERCSKWSDGSTNG